MANGQVEALDVVKDPVFSQKMMGDGFAVEPTDGNISVPVSGTVTSVFPTKHAIGLVSETGIELLIHVGLNTVELKGQYFDTLVEPGQTVKKGQAILNFDLEKIKESGYETQVPVVITNSPQYSSIELTNKGRLLNNEEVLIVKV